MTATFQPGDRVTEPHAERPEHRSIVGTVLNVTSTHADVEWPGKGIHRLADLRHVPVTAEHVGQWARGTGTLSGIARRGVVVSFDGSDVVINNKSNTRWIRDAVLVAAPSPVPVAPAPAEPTDCGKCRDADLWRNKPTEHTPVAPAPDQDDEPGLPWRVGGNYGLHAYADESWDVDTTKDRPVATFHRPADAALAVSRVNAHAALTARAEQAEAEVHRLRVGRDEDDKEINDLTDQAEALRAERDAARAELAAANTTDGLALSDLPEPPPLLAVRMDLSPHENTTRLVDTLVAQTRYADDLVRRLRARLAQEAPTTKDDDRG